MCVAFKFIQSDDHSFYDKMLRDWRRKKADQDLPPYNGFGSEEDSKTSCNGLEPRPPQRDFYKFMNRDRYIHIRQNERRS